MYHAKYELCFQGLRSPRTLFKLMFQTMKYHLMCVFFKKKTISNYKNVTKENLRSHAGFKNK
jgi:hypothetical protein